MADPVTIGIALTVADTAFSFISGMQEADAMEAQAEQQRRIAEVQARNAQAIAERNAQIQEQQAAFKARQFEEQAGQEQAEAMQAAMNLRRQKELAQSKTRAISAASGAGALDPTVENLIGGLEEEGELNALNALFSGDSQAALLQSQADLTRFSGDRNAESIRFGGATDAQLLNFQGESALFEGKSNARTQRINTIGNTVSSLTRFIPTGGSSSLGTGSAGASLSTFRNPPGSKLSSSPMLLT